MSKSTRIPKYRLHKPSGQAVVTIKGQDHYLGAHDSEESRDLYDRLITEYLLSGRSRTTTQKFDGPAVSEVCLAYYRYAENYYIGPDGKHTQSIKRVKVAIRHLRRLYGDTPAADFGPLALQVIREKLVEHGYSRKYINHITSALKRIFKWAASQELVPASVYQALQTVAGLCKGRTTAPEPKLIPPVADELVDQTLPHLPPIVADMVRVQRLIGCRPGEIIIMRPIDINREDQVWLYRPPHHKTSWRDKSRVIPIGPRAQAILMAYMDRPEESYCFSPQESKALLAIELRKKRKTKVQPSQRNRRKKAPKRPPGDHYTTGSYGRTIKTACQKANLQHWTPNQLRKAAAVTVRENFDLEHAKSVLGHDKSTTTEQFYADKDLRRAIEVAKRIG